MTSNNDTLAVHCLTDRIKEPPLPEILTDAQASHWLLRAGYFFKENHYFAPLLIPVVLLIPARYVYLNWPWLLDGAALWVALAIGVTPFMVFLGLLFWRHESLLAPLNESRLTRMVEIAEADPTVRAWVQQALTDGKTLRLRDYKAAATHRTWHISNQRRLTRLEALRKLADPTEPESQTLTASGAYPTQDERIDGPRTEA